MAVRTSRTITDKKEIDYILSLKGEDLERLSVIMELFGQFHGKARFHTYDVITIPAGSYGPEGKKNKNSFTTTVGRYVFNKFIVEEDLFDMLGYINEPVTDNLIGDIGDRISYDLLEDKCDLGTLKRFLMRCQKCQPYSNVLAPSFSLKMLTMSKQLDILKRKLIKDNAEAIQRGDVKVVSDIEKILLDESKKILKDDPSMDIYGSGAKGKFGNNFKNLFVMKGASKDPTPGKGYNIITSNYIDGISKDEYVITAKSMTEGVYSRSKKTAKGGYWEKLFLRAFQHIVLDKPGTDCGTKRTVSVHLTPKNIDMWMYNYIVENGKLIELTYELRSKYVNKTVRMRYSSMCEGKDHICNACAGNMFYRLGIMNIGTAMPQLASKLKLISMKAFHDSQVKLHEIDVAKAFSDDD